jgi:hypothetical protein
MTATTYNVLRDTCVASLLTGALWLASIATAADKPLPAKKIMAAVKAYANSIGCFVHMDPRNVARAKVDRIKPIVALYSIDETCSGGTAMHRPAFAVLVPDDHGGLLVLPEYSIPSSTSEKLPQYTERIFVKGEELWFSGQVFNWDNKAPSEEGDALCCPSVSVEGRVIFNPGKKAEWTTE